MAYWCGSAEHHRFPSWENKTMTNLLPADVKTSSSKKCIVIETHHPEILTRMVLFKSVTVLTNWGILKLIAGAFHIL